jgi:predicted alpha/beta-hydrolase family hydrolase
LILLSYPLHRPGHPEELRVEHWPQIACPVLLLSGESDPFARVDLLRANVSLLRDARLVTYPGVQHGLAPVLDDAMNQVAEFVRGLG